MFFPDLETDRLLLRKLTLDDTGFIFSHFSNPDVCQYLYDAEPFTDSSEAEGLILYYDNLDNRNHCRWALLLKETGDVIGTCGFHFWDKENNIAETGYDLAREYWGRGYMAEAMAAALDNGFGNMKLNRVQAFIYTGNARSSGLAEKLGFKNEGTIREKHYFRGEYYDHYCYSLLKREWQTVKLFRNSKSFPQLINRNLLLNYLW